MAEYKKETKEEGKLIFTELCLIYLFGFYFFENNPDCQK